MKRYLVLQIMLLIGLVMRAEDVTEKSGQTGALTVTSHVVDAKTGEALSFVSVSVGPTNSTMTNYDGDFTITADSGSVVRLTYVGYEEVKFQATNVPSKVTMKPLQNVLREVQVRAWASLLNKVAKKTYSEYNVRQRKKSQYFMRTTTSLRTRDLAEAFVEANSAFNLRNITIIKGVNGRITQQGLSAPIIASMNFHHALEVGPMTRDAAFWKKLITPLNRNSSAGDYDLYTLYTLVTSGKMNDSKEPTLADITSFYDVTGEELVDENQRLIYRLYINKADKQTSNQAIMTGTLYVDAKSMRPMRFEGKVENISVQARKDLQIVSVPIEMDLHINYRHDRKFTEVNDIAVKMKSGDFMSQTLLYNVDDLGLDLKAKKTNRTNENMLESINKAGFDLELWKRANIVQRTKEEERLAGLENQTEIIKDSIPDPTTKMGRLLDRLSRFNHTMPQEKVYLHMDNTSYFLGDTIWFAAYSRQTNNDQPSRISRVLYVELYNQDGYMMERKLVEMRDGRGYGSFALNKDYYGGFYELRAYTRWQLNWGLKEHPHSKVSREWYLNKEQELLHYRDYEKLYSRVFPVYDAPKKEGEYVENMTARPMRRYFKKDPDKPSLELNLYPEGGSLVEGLPCHVAYEALWEDGEEAGDGILNLGDDDSKSEASAAKQLAKDQRKQAKQELRNATKKGAKEQQTSTAQATRMPSDTLSWRKHRGTFVVTPGKDVERTIRFVDRKGNEVKAKLPKAEREGVALHVEQTDTTWTFDIAFTTGIQRDSLGLTIMCEGNVQKILTLEKDNQDSTVVTNLSMDYLTADSLRAFISIPKCELKEGVNQVTIFDVDGRIWADRLFFNTQPDSISAPTSKKRDVAINVIGDERPVGEQYFEPYQQIRLGVQSEPNSTISMSIRDAAYNDHLYDNATMRTEMLLASEVRGFIPNPNWYFEKDDKEHREALDLLLMIQGWRRFNWREMAVPKQWELSQMAESTPVVSGHVYKSSSWEYHDFNDFDYALQARLSNIYNVDNPVGLVYADLSSFGSTESEVIEGEQIRETDPYMLYSDGSYNKAQAEGDMMDDNEAQKKKKKDILLHAELVSLDGTETRQAEQNTHDGKFRILLPGFYGEAVLFLSAADATQWSLHDDSQSKKKSKEKSKGKKEEKKYNWVDMKGKNPADYKVIVDYPYPRFVKPYNYYQQHLLNVSDSLMGSGLLTDGTYMLREVRIGAKRNGLKSFSDSIPAFMVDAYQAYNDAIDGGIYYPSTTMIVRNYLGDYGQDFPFVYKHDPRSGHTVQLSGIVHRFGYDVTRRTFNNLTTAEDSIYMRGNLASLQPFDEFGHPTIFMSQQEIAKYYDLSRIDKYIIYTDYQPRLEGSSRYYGSDIPKTAIAIYPFADDSRRPVYRDRRIIYKGYAYHDRFYHPNYKNRKLGETPKDYRRTLYWNPKLQLDKDGHAEVELYNNGKHGQINISAEGMAKDGTILGN